MASSQDVAGWSVALVSGHLSYLLLPFPRWDYLWISRSDSSPSSSSGWYKAVSFTWCLVLCCAVLCDLVAPKGCLPWTALPLCVPLDLMIKLPAMGFASAAGPVSKAEVSGHEVARMPLDMGFLTLIDVFGKAPLNGTPVWSCK